MEYPTLFTAGTRWLAPAHVTTPEGVTVHEAGHQFWYGIVGNNEFEDAWMDEGFNTFSTARAIAQVYDPNYYSRRYFGGFIPWVFKDIPLIARDRRQPACRAIACAAKTDAPVDADVPLLPRDRRRDHLQQDGAVAEHAWSAGSDGRRCSRSCRRISRAGSSSIRSRVTSSTIANEVAGRDLGWFFDQVYRSSNVFDYGVEDLESVR